MSWNRFIGIVLADDRQAVNDSLNADGFPGDHFSIEIINHPGPQGTIVAYGCDWNDTAANWLAIMSITAPWATWHNEGTWQQRRKDNGRGLGPLLARLGKQRKRNTET